MISEQIEREIKRLMRRCAALEQELATLPEGSILCIKNGGYVRWLLSNSGTPPTYLPKSKRALAEALAVRKYDTLLLEELSTQVRILERCLISYKKCKSKSDALLADTSCYQELLRTYYNNFSTQVQQWKDAAYEHCSKHPENLLHSTLAGHKVRSKSEVIIANSLFLAGLPYRYECGLTLNHVTFYPDFTILHPQTLQTFYWEHFGMMDRPSYVEHSYNKLKLYGTHHIIPSINLITTYETQTNPIHSEKVQKLIEEYFL